VIPVYGFLQGDTLGILLFIYEDDTIDGVRKKLQQAASVRVAPTENMIVIYRDKVLNLNMTVSQSGIEPLERIDVVTNKIGTMNNGI
jgi:hypothetical protein